jgi:hypothetical protein
MKNTILLITCLASLLIGCSTPEPIPTKGQVLKAAAKAATLERLKAPTTAIFYDDLATAHLLADGANAGNHSVIIHVDAQNSFGATLRHRYNNVLKFNGGDSLKVDDYQLVHFFELK